jgi:hypothetical protein
MAKYLTLKDAAAYITATYGVPISHRTLEAWGDLPHRVINKLRVLTQAEIDAAIQRRAKPRQLAA